MNKLHTYKLLYNFVGLFYFILFIYFYIRFIERGDQPLTTAAPEEETTPLMLPLPDEGTVNCQSSWNTNIWEEKLTLSIT